MKSIEQNRTIESVLDIQTGLEIMARDFFNKDINEIFNIRYDLETGIREKTPKYICFYCKQPIKIRGQRDSKTIFHFAHLRDSDDCPIKTDNKYTKDEILRIKYNGAKESNLHFYLKNQISKFLKLNKDIQNVEVEKVYKDKAIPKNWKKPDVSCIYNGFEFVLELQLSTTFLSVINARQEFYKNNQSFILWIFSAFIESEDSRKFTQSDIFFNNNHNGFEFNNDCIEMSEKENDLVLKCYFNKPIFKDNKLDYKLETKFVRLKELKFNKGNFEVYYYDYNSEYNFYNKLFEFNLFKEIFYGNEGSIVEMFLKGYQITTTEKDKLKSLYDKEIKNIQLVGNRNWKFNIVWVMILMKFKNTKQIIRIQERFNRDLAPVIFAILSLKLDKIIGYEFKNQIQVAHRILDGRKAYTEIYLKALKLYKPNFLETDDKTGKLRILINKYYIEKPLQNHENNDILNIMFPEILL